MGHPRCHQCHHPIGRTASRGKWPKIKHTPRCPKQPAAQSEAASAAAAVPAAPDADAPKRSHKRARSDPGEPPSARSPSPRRTRPTTTRITPPTPAAAQKKPRTTRQDDRIMRLLDETHARRMAMMKQEQ